MIVIAAKAGQLGNRLILFAHFIACARENGLRIVNPTFDEYAPFFRGTRRDFLCRYPPKDSPIRIPPWVRGLLDSLLFRMVRLLALLRCTEFPFKIIKLRQLEELFDLSNEAFVETASRRSIVFVQGWRFRDTQNFHRHAEAIRSYFRPIELHEQNVERVIEEARSRCDILVGVHIRQGDYARFEGGRYFYSATQYRSFMERIALQFPSRKVGFLVCSNVPQDPEVFKGLAFVFGTGHFVEDMYAFARCDYLIGPPSTYTNWPSFYGEVPLFKIKNQDAKMELEGFRVIRA